MRFIFLSVLAAGLAIVGYQLVKMDPLPIRMAAGGGAWSVSGTGVVVRSDAAEAAAADTAAPSVTPRAGVAGQSASPAQADRVPGDEASKWLSSEGAPRSERQVREVRIISKPLRYTSRGFLGDDGDETAPAAGGGASDASAQRIGEPVRARKTVKPGVGGAAATEDVAFASRGGSSERTAEVDDLPEVVRIEAAAAVRPASSRGDRAVVPVPSQIPPAARQHFAAAALSTPVPAIAVIPPLPEWSGRDPVARVALSRRDDVEDDAVAARPPKASLSGGRAERAPRATSKKPLFKYRTHCHPSYGCERVLYARKPRNAKEAQRIRKMRNRIMARRIQRYGYAY